MQILPDFATFEAGFAAGRSQAVYCTIPADLDTPVSLMLKLTQARRDSFMLESVTGGDTRGRYSFIGFKPDLIWRCRGDRAEINRSARWDSDAFEHDPRPVLESLRAALEESRIELPRGLPPGMAGLFGYLGYDMVRHVERLPEPNADPLGLPDAVMMRPTIVAAVDSVKDEVTFVTPVRAGTGETARAAYARAAERLSDAVMDLDRAPGEARADGDPAPAPEQVSNTTFERYLEVVNKAKEYILAGDIFQVVPSQRWTVDFPSRPSRSTGRCGAPTRRPTCSSSTSAASRWSAPRRRSSCGSARARSPSAPSPAPAPAARRRRRTTRWRPTCSPIPRSGRST